MAGGGQQSDELLTPLMRDCLGYLNFSSGQPDARFQRQWHDLFTACLARSPAGPVWLDLADRLEAELALAQVDSHTFRDVEQARRVIELALRRVPAAYRAFHSDLLFHQTDEVLFQPLFLARVIEAVLVERATDQPDDFVARRVVAGLNDYVGYRPVAVLNSSQKMEPYAHERLRPIPLYLCEVGVARGPYHDLLVQAFAILRATDPDLLEQCCFELSLLDELAFDPRAYDFDHPANKRPNHHFGQWDPYHLDKQGRYRRFVLQQVTLDVLLTRVQESPPELRSDRLWEAAAVLVGTTLMAAMTSGRSPDYHDSSVTLANLVPRIAQVRDRFYDQLLRTAPGTLAARLVDEAHQLRQPLGGARQHLNQGLARLRARQQQHVHLAQLFARMGYPEASLRQAQIVPAASARMASEIDCRVASGHHALDRGQLAEAAAVLPEIDDLVSRAINCGALVDPWNLLGFQGQYPVFQSLENSVRDHRVDHLIELLERVFALDARLLSEAAAAGNEPLRAAASRRLAERASWWDQFASTSVSGVRYLSGEEARDSAEQVASALGAWHRGGAAAGDVAFWRDHVAGFATSPSYALVVEALLDKRDYVASMALLVEWLSRAGDLTLEESDSSFHVLALRWLREMGRRHQPPRKPDQGPASADELAEARWNLARKFLDFVEANAEEWWQPPQWRDADPGRPPDGGRSGRATPGDAAADLPDEHDEEPAEEVGGLYRAAYEDVVFRDSTADGVEGSTLDSGVVPTDDLWEHELRRLSPRLGLLSTVARLWKLASAMAMTAPAGSTWPATAAPTLEAWGAQALANRAGLLRLLDRVQHERLPAPLPTREAQLEHDRRRQAKYSLLERVAADCAAAADAARFALAAAPGQSWATELEPWEQQGVHLVRAMFAGDRATLAERLPEFRRLVQAEPLLYVPVHRGGAPQGMVRCQRLLHLLRELAAGLPQSGLLNETCRLLVAVQSAEQQHAAGEGAVTEFDRLFQIAYRGLVECLVNSAADWSRTEAGASDESDASDEDLVLLLQQFTESLLERWLQHSRSLRLSALERVSGDARWKTMVEFIERYGHDLFTLRFFNPSNLRSILDEGVDTYLTHLAAHEADDPPRLIEELDQQIPRADAVRALETIVSAVLENYAEYRDYNSTTTQSDRGELLYTLLDFLRLKARYDRVSWNLKPVVLAHQILVRAGRAAAAEQWRRTVAERTREAADWHLARLEALCQKHGMRLPTVADRLEERFVRPLALDRIRALIRPAIEEKRRGLPQVTFPFLEQELAEFGRRPTGAGLDLPAWLATLELEVEQARLAGDGAPDAPEFGLPLPQARLTRDEAEGEWEAWSPGE